MVIFNYFGGCVAVAGGWCDSVSVGEGDEYVQVVIWPWPKHSVRAIISPHC